MKKYIVYIGLGLSAALFAACGNNNANTPKNNTTAETRTSGKITIAVDESYEPVMQQQINVFDSSNPAATISPKYLAENDCLSELFQGKVSMAMVTRELTDKEKKACEANNIYTRSVAVVEDAIAVIVNNKSQDSLMTVGQLKAILTGTFARKYNVVVDNNNGSIARYITESLIPGQKLSSQLYAAKSSAEVIKYVSENADALGLLGVSHVYDQSSSISYGSFLKSAKVVAFKNDSMQKFIQPYQASIALKDYPFTRKLYFIVNQSSELAAGFANFLTSEPGQMIFNKARLIPLHSQLIIREVEIKP